MQPPRACKNARARIVVLFHSAAGGTRLVAELLGELLSPDHDVQVTSIFAPAAVDDFRGADFVVLCYPTYFLRPSPSMREFIGRLGDGGGRRRAYLVTTYELYTENSLRACALLLKGKGTIVTGSAAIRAPGSDLTCVVPDRLCGWLYRFERGMPEKLRSIARDVSTLAVGTAAERLPRWKWYTPAARALQWLFDGFFAWRARIHILPERCTACGACITRCQRGAWVKADGTIRHLPDRCELCTACIHHCARHAIVLAAALRDNRRLDDRHYADLRGHARRALLPYG